MKAARNLCLASPVGIRTTVLAADDFLLRACRGPIGDRSRRSLEDNDEELRAAPEIGRRSNREARDAGVLVVVALLGDVVQILERRNAVLCPRAGQRNRRYLAGVDRREQ